MIGSDILRSADECRQHCIIERELADRHCRYAAVGASGPTALIGRRLNERFLDKAGKVSRIHHKKPRGKPMPHAVSRANAARSKIRARVEHVFAEQKDRMGLFIRTIGIARAEAAITLANMAYNMKRWCWLDGRIAPSAPSLARAQPRDNAREQIEPSLSLSGSNSSAVSNARWIRFLLLLGFER